MLVFDQELGKLKRLILISLYFRGFHPWIFCREITVNGVLSRNTLKPTLYPRNCLP